MKNPSPQKIKALTILFFVAGAWGIYIGLFYFANPSFPLTALGVVNLVLGIYLGFRHLRKNNTPDFKRKK